MVWNFNPEGGERIHSSPLSVSITLQDTQCLFHTAGYSLWTHTILVVSLGEVLSSAGTLSFGVPQASSAITLFHNSSSNTEIVSLCKQWVNNLNSSFFRGGLWDVTTLQKSKSSQMLQFSNSRLLCTFSISWDVEGCHYPPIVQKSSNVSISTILSFSVTVLLVEDVEWGGVVQNPPLAVDVL